MALILKDILAALEAFAPPQYQASYDNARLITGDPGQTVNGALLTLDCTEAVVDEAIARGAELIIAHHPIVFSGLKSLTGRTYVERVIIKAIRHNIAIYASHTNLDHALAGVNRRIARQLGLENLRILEPMSGILNLLYVYVPHEHLEPVRQALFKAGAGHIGHYSECSFAVEGTGSFLPGEAATPERGERHTLRLEPETRLEVLVPAHLEQRVLAAMRTAHPYEEIAYGIIALKNAHQEWGAGMVGELPEPMSAAGFPAWLKSRMGVSCVRHTRPAGDSIHRVALCGGAGISLLKAAIGSGAQAFVTADVKYHEFFDAEGHLLLADIGHYESERFTPEIFLTVLSEKFPNFALHLSAVNTNPIHYF